MNDEKWPIVKLNDCATFQEGYVNPSQKKPEYFGNEVKWLRANDLQDSYVHDTSRRLSHKGYESAGKSALLFEPNTLAISKSGTIGRLGILKDYMCGNRAVINVKVDKAKCDNLFVFYAMIYKRREIIALATGSVQKNLYTSVLGSVQLKLPPLPTQRKIASILSAYDDLIENNTRRIAILEEMAQAIYREWFVNFRFPGHENVKLVDSPLGMIPEGWGVSPFSEVADFVNGFAFKPAHQEEAGKPIIKIAELKNGITTKTPFNSGADIAEKYHIHNGDVLFSWSADLDAYIWMLGDGLLNQHLFVCIPKKQTSKLHLYFALKDRMHEFRQRSLGTTMRHIKRSALKEVVCCVPDEVVRRAFEEQVSPLIELKQALVTKQGNLRTTRDLLLPMLISGKLDVEDLDIDLGILSEEMNQQETSEPQEKAHAFKSGAKKSEPKAKESKPQKSPIDEIETESIMIEFRQAARKLGTTNREDLLKAVSKGLGYKRIGSKIQDSLKGHLRAAIRRKIIGASGDEVWPETPAMDSYERDELVDTLKSVMRKNQQYERDDVIRLVANYLGFKRVSKTLQKPVKSAITGAIRRQILNYEGSIIWREN